jgi:hypothetical protein
VVQMVQALRTCERKRGLFRTRAADSAKTQVDCAGGELTGFEMRAIPKDHFLLNAKRGSEHASQRIRRQRDDSPALRLLSSGCSTPRPGMDAKSDT